MYVLLKTMVRGQQASWGPCPASVLADKTEYKFVWAVPADARAPLTNAKQANGNIVLVNRGAVTFSAKVDRAAAAGAVAVVIVNNNTDAPNTVLSMANDDETSAASIPVLMISFNDGLEMEDNSVFLVVRLTYCIHSFVRPEVPFRA
jgi:hypothetical protein